jgi:hypothetical protein
LESWQTGGIRAGVSWVIQGAVRDVRGTLVMRLAETRAKTVSECSGLAMHMAPEQIEYSTLHKITATEYIELRFRCPRLSKRLARVEEDIRSKKDRL